MPVENKTLKLIKSVVGLVQNSFSLIGDIASLMSLELQLAGKSIIWILVLAFVIFSLLTSTWICVLALIFILLNSIPLAIGWSLFILIILNLLAIIIMVLIILSLKNNLSFTFTRNQLRRLKLNR